MKHEQFNEWLQLWFYQELNADEAVLLEKHLTSCAECREEKANLERFHNLLAAHAPATTTEDVLREARVQLRMQLREELAKRSRWDELIDSVAGLFTPKIQVALAGAAMLVVGFVVGSRWMAKTELPIGGGAETISSSSISSFVSGDGQISNFRFVSRDERSGEVEFSFDATRPVRIKGNIGDPHIQQLLARTLVTEQNPGVRLHAVNAIAEQATMPMASVSNDVKDALIAALKYDNNSGVRQEALRVLQKYLPDPAVTQAFIYILKNEKNTGMKIAAINALDISKFEGQPSKNELLDIFKRTMESEGNNYIRLRARAALKEAQQ